MAKRSTSHLGKSNGSKRSAGGAKKRAAVASRAVVKRASAAVRNIGFESLENRQMMSTVNVANYGAVANDGRDDSAAIRAAVAAAHSGDVISFGQGTYDMSSQVGTNTGLTFQGVHGKTVIDAPNGAQAFKVGNGQSATINDFNFNGGVIFVDGKAKVVITGNDVTNFDNSGDVGCGRGAIGGTGAQLDTGSYIANNDFHDSQNGRTIYFFTAFNTVIEDNSFRNVFLGIKSNNADIVKAKNLTIRRNYFTENRYHSVELQGTIDGFWFTDNYYEHPRLSNNFNENNSVFAWSLIYTKPSTDQHILRNYVNAPERPDGTGIRLSFEVGEFAEVKGNYIRGGGTVLTVYGPGTVVDGNNFDGARWGTGYIYGSQRGLTNSVITSNNNANVHLSWDVNRAKPGPYKGTGTTGPSTGDNTSGGTTGGGTTGGGTTGGGTIDTGTDAPVASGSVTNVAARVWSDDTVKLTWDSDVENVKYYRVEIVSTLGREVFRSVIVKDTTSNYASIKQLHTGWLLDLTVVAVTADGEVRSDAQTVQMTGDPTALAGAHPKLSPNSARTSAFTKTSLESLTLTDSDGDGVAAASTIKKSINGRDFSRGLTVNDGTTLKYDLNGDYDYFCAYIGQDDLVETNGVVKFQVVGDGKTLYSSGVNNTSRARKIKVNVEGVDKLWLVVTDAAGTSQTVKADWATPYLLAA